MLKSTDRELSNLSYTNKDFQTIYPELLDLAKKLSYKWDPSMSDETDPGVILLKLAALMADKNNYNIDKNILELFPLSVTQESNARQLYDQLGYVMRYFQSATTNIQFTITNPPIPNETQAGQLGIINVPAENNWKWNKEHETIYTIPKFTMVSDSENNIVYTITEDTVLSSNGITVSSPAIQGIATQYRINGQELITAADLDYKRRLYFNERDVCENGIFISLKSDPNSEWQKVDNLFIQPLGTLCYKFGITQNGTQCYIEFPNDIDTIISSGITITYLRSMGLEGNIAKNKLIQFYTDINVEAHLKSKNDTTTIALKSENIHITNSWYANDGQNPETIDDAYKGYQKIKNTFNTLVSTADYTNFMISNEKVSNGYVCDRSDDIQTSYKLLNTSNNNNLSVYNNDKIIDSDDQMTAFNLKVYALSYVDNVNNPAGFIESFRPLSYETSTVTDMYSLHNYQTGWGDLKTICHDFLDPLGDEIMMIKNKYPLDITIIPQYKVTDLQASEIKNSIRTALYQNLNSKELQFGESIPYNIVYDIILNSDSRIKSVILQNINYETYAIYKEPDVSQYDEITQQTKIIYGDIKELRIDSNSTRPFNENTLDEKEQHINSLWDKFRDQIFVRSVLSGKTQFLIADDTFEHTLYETNSHQINDIYRLSTNTDISVEWTEKTEAERVSPVESRILDSNENMVFTAVNLIDDIPYSTYVKFLYKLNKKEHTSNEDILIDSNSDYTLQSDEFLYFFWKANESDQYYTFRRYDTNTPINTFNPSFNLVASQPDYKLNDTNINISGIIDSLNDKINNKTLNSFESIHGCIEGFLDGELTGIISALAGSDYVLTGSNQIVTKKINRIHLNNKSGNGTNKLYWILNNKTENQKYRLFDKLTYDSSYTPGLPTQSYVLQNGEYLIYANDAQTQLNMLSSGTIITRILDESLAETSGFLPIWEVPAISYDDFISDPFAILNDNWYDVEPLINVYATEQQWYQIGNKYKIKLNPLNETNDYKSITFTSSNPIAEKWDGTTDNSFETLYNYKISLIDTTNNLNTLTILPVRNVPEYGWKVNTLLNINAGPSSSQILKPGQSIKFFDSAEQLMEFTLSPEKETTVQFLTNREVSLTGGEKIDCTILNTDTNSIEPLSVYSYQNAVYTYNQSEAEEVIEFKINPSTKTLTLEIPPNIDQETDLNIALPKGEYLIPVTIENARLSNIILSFNYTDDKGNHQIPLIPLENINDSILVDEIPNSITLGTGNHYLKLDLSNADTSIIEGRLYVKVEKSESMQDIPSSLVVFNCPYKYIPNPSYKKDTYTELLTLLNTYNKDMLFSYTYQVPEAQLIQNPLNSISFLNSEHPYNKFTICEWNIKDLQNNKLIIETHIK